MFLDVPHLGETALLYRVRDFECFELFANLEASLLAMACPHVAQRTEAAPVLVWLGKFSDQIYVAIGAAREAGAIFSFAFRAEHFEENYTYSIFSRF
jgi:hypothetical protein